MWEPLEISYTNLFSHSESNYEFQNGKCVIIHGKNLADSSLDNNGSGKSTLFEAVHLGIRGESIRGLNKESFINNDSEEASVNISFDNKFLKTTMTIIRQFHRHKTAKVEVYENGVLNEQLTSVNEANAYILEQLGITKEDLSRYFIIGQDNRYTFFTAGDADKKEIINRITSADMVNPIIDELNSRTSALQGEISTLESDRNVVIGKVELIDEQLAEFAEAAEEDENELTELKVNLKFEQDSLKVYDDLIKISRDRIASINDINFTLSKNEKTIDIKKAKLGLKASIEEEDEAKRTIKTLKSCLEDEITCPNCEHVFINSSEFDLTKEEAETLLSATIELREAQKEIRQKFQNKIDEVLDIREKIDDNEIEIDNEARLIRRYEREKQDAISRINKITQKIKEFGSSVDQSFIDKLTNQRSELSSQIDKQTESINLLLDDYEMARFWKTNFGKAGFATYLANKSIKVIEGITNSFLKKFKVDLSVLINGFTINKDQTIREKIEVFIQSDGLTPTLFMAGSGGERGRINLAGILGIQHLINMSTDGRGLNLLLLDEVFPGIDSMGQENIINTLQELGITILIITQQVSEKFNSDNALFVIKDTKGSRYVKREEFYLTDSIEGVLG